MSMGVIQNSYAETIIPAGGAFVLDELYYGQRIQVGGARNSLLDSEYNYTNLFIKTASDDSGKIEYVKIALEAREKIIIDVAKHSFEVDENNEVTTSAFDIIFYLLEVDEPYLGYENRKREPVLVTSLGYINGQFFALPAETVSDNLSELGIGPHQIEIVDKPKPKIQPHLLEWQLVR